MGRKLALALLLVAFALPARGQNKQHFPAQQAIRISFREIGKSGGRGTVSLKTRGLPVNTAVEFGVKLDGGQIDASWARGLVTQGGRLKLPIGPFSKSLLPGVYRLILKVNPDQQDASLDNVFEKWNGKEAARTYLWRYRPEAEKEARAQVRIKLMQANRDMLDVLSRVLKAGREYREGQKFFSKGGAFDSEAFSLWAKQAVAPLFAGRLSVSGLLDENLAPYHPRVFRGDMPNLFLMVRIAVIDYTIHPIHMREKLTVPTQFQPLKDVLMKPTRKQSIGRAQLLGRQISKKLDLGQQQPMLAALFPAEDKLPADFQLAELIGELAGLVPANPGATMDVKESAMQKVGRQLGVKQPASDVQEFAMLALAARKATDTEKSPVVLYLFRFKQETYSLLLQEQLRKRQLEGQFDGRLLVKQDIVAVITSSKKTAQRKAVKLLVKHLSGKHGFKESRN